LSQLNNFLSTCLAWVVMALRTNKAKEYITYIYPALIPLSTIPDLTQYRADPQYLSQLILSMGKVPSQLQFSKVGITRVISKEFGYLETDLYRFSPYGCLIYDKNYRASKDYIESYVLPAIAKIRGTQASFERMNEILNHEIENMQKSTIKNLQESYEYISGLRVSSLNSLAKAEFSRTEPQLTEVSDELRTIFGISKLQASMEKKIEILKSFLERLTADRASRFERRLSRFNMLLAIISVLLAASALPPILKILHLGT
jgi:hypothetical protein